MYQYGISLIDPTTVRYSGVGFMHPVEKPAFTGRSLRSPSSHLSPRANSVPQSPSPYSQNHTQGSFSSAPPTIFHPAPAPAFSLPASYQSATHPSAAYPSAFPSVPYTPVYPVAPTYPYTSVVGTGRTTSQFGLEVILIAILILTALDLTFVRPLKCRQSK